MWEFPHFNKNSSKSSYLCPVACSRERCSDPLVREGTKLTHNVSLHRSPSLDLLPSALQPFPMNLLDPKPPDPPFHVFLRRLLPFSCYFAILQACCLFGPCYYCCCYRCTCCCHCPTFCDLVDCCPHHLCRFFFDPQPPGPPLSICLGPQVSICSSLAYSRFMLLPSNYGELGIDLQLTGLVLELACRCICMYDIIVCGLALFAQDFSGS